MLERLALSGALRASLAGVRSRGGAPADRSDGRARGALRSGREPGSPTRRAAPLGLLAGLLLAEAVVTAVLNLDTAVVFMTPVLLHAARARGAGEGPFLYGAVFMANAASLLLPGSNLTNLIVLAHEHISGATFAARLAPAWAVSVALTIVVVAIAFRRDLREASPAHGACRTSRRVSALRPSSRSRRARARARAAGAARARARRRRSRARLARRVSRAANPWLLLSCFALAVLLGTLARHVHIALLDGAGRWQTAGIAALRRRRREQPARRDAPLRAPAGASARAAPRARSRPEPRASRARSRPSSGWQVARANGARPSIVRYTKIGVVLVPLTIAASLLVTRV